MTKPTEAYICSTLECNNIAKYGVIQKGYKVINLETKEVVEDNNGEHQSEAYCKECAMKEGYLNQ